MSTGIKGQWGLKEESTWGTAVTVDEFFPIMSHSVNEDIDRIESDTQIAGRRTMDSTQWKEGARSVGVSVQSLLYATGTRNLLKQMFGGETGAGPYTYTPTDLEGTSFTGQVGIPGTGGTVHPFTYSGAKVSSWEIAANEGNNVTLGWDILAKDVTTGTALATASYGTLNPFCFVNSSFTIAGSAYKVKQFRLAGNNSLVERRFDGQNHTDEPLEEDLRVYDGSFTSEFIDLTQMNRFRNGTEAALVSTFNDGAGNTLVITKNVRFDGSTPDLAGRGIVDLDVPYKCVGSTDAAAITAVLTLA